jgi:DNA (cytosine-5)-methyltransferase 1
MKDPVFIIIDLFCGAGGTTTGFAQAKDNIAKVIACVNHDPKAIESHWKNHPDVKHFEEDIRTLDLTELAICAKDWQDQFPDAKLVLWASLECTNFSKAKGGQPRDADSRTLADHLHRYVELLRPDYVKIENVVEFMSWGPLDEKGKPVSRKNGSDWMRWCREMCAHGYINEWKELNSADFGAYTSRNRLFGIFARPDLPICWPESTHSKKPGKGMFEALKKWMAVKHVLDFSDEGQSIFTRKKTLSEKTLERIYAGLLKYVAKGDTAFISKYFSGRPKGKVNSVNEPGPTNTTFGGNTLVQAKSFADLSIDQPAGSITTKDHHAIVQTEFLTHYYGQGGGQHSSIENPAPTIPTKARTAIISPEFLTIYNGKSLHRSVDEPSPVIATNDRLGLVQPEYFIDKHFSKSQNQSIDQPAGSVMPNDKHRLVEATPFMLDTQWSTRNGHPAKSIEEPCRTLLASGSTPFIVNPSHGGHSTSTDQPCPVVIARQDKAPLCLVQVENGPVAIAIYEGESDVMILIKEFMAVYSLVDIKMRMLRVHELLKIQGFPNEYVLCGNQSDQKKFIGNSVVPLVVKVWAEALADRLIDNSKTKVA